MSTTTLTIGELAIDLESTDLTACRIDRAVAADFEVEVDFTYTPGHEGNTWGRWEDAEEPISPTVEIHAVKTEAALHFEGDHAEVIIKRGTDIKDLFSGREITALEDRIYAEIQSA